MRDRGREKKMIFYFLVPLLKMCEFKLKSIIPITTVMQTSAVTKFLVRHIIRSAIFSLKKQQLCTIFRTLVTGQSRAIKVSVIYLPRNVHGKTASQGTMFTIQPCENSQKFVNRIIKFSTSKIAFFLLLLLVESLRGNTWATMTVARRSNYFGMHEQQPSPKTQIVEKAIATVRNH